MLGAVRGFDETQRVNAASRVAELERQVPLAREQRVKEALAAMEAAGKASVEAKVRQAAERAAAAREGQGPSEEIAQLLNAYPSLPPEKQLEVRQYLAEQQGPGMAERLLGMRLGANRAMADTGTKGYLSRGGAYTGAAAGGVAGAMALMEAMEALQPGSTEGLEA